VNHEDQRSHLVALSITLSLIRAMNSKLNQQEREKVRAARANFFQVQKRKISTAGDSQLESTPATSSTHKNDMSSSKRFKFPGMTSTKPSTTASKTPLIVRFYDADVQAKDAHGRTQEIILAWPNSKLESCHNYIQMLFPVPEGSAFNWEAPIIDREVMGTFRARSDLRNRLRLSFERMLEFYGFKVALEPEKKEETEETEETQPEEKSGNVAGGAEQRAIGTTKAKESTKEATDVQDATEEGKSKTEGSTPKSTFPPGAHSDSTASPGYYIVRAPQWRSFFRNWAVRFDHNHLRITRILRCLRVLGLQTECDAFFEALKNVYNDPAINISDRTFMYWTRAVTRPLHIAPDDDEIDWLKEWEDEQAAKKGDKEDEDKTEESREDGKAANAEGTEDKNE
jgi:hypothetical protein